MARDTHYATVQILITGGIPVSGDSPDALMEAALKKVRADAKKILDVFPGTHGCYEETPEMITQVRVSNVRDNESGDPIIAAITDWTHA